MSEKENFQPSESFPDRKVYILHGKRFETPSKFSVTKIIGFGAYGLVAAVSDESTGRSFAIKKCRNICRSLGDGKRILREVKLLRFMEHENVLRLDDFYVTREEGGLADAYLVTELLDTDLHNVIRSRQKFTEDHIKYFTYQIIRGLKYIHSAGVLHRDLKPANLLVNVNCDLKIADLGLARGHSGDDPKEEALTDYVVTRWYRPPELLLMNKHYTTSVDIWSTGCIFLELLNRQPAFPGKDYLDQLSRILSAIGSKQTLDANFCDFLENAEAKKFMSAQQGRFRWEEDDAAIQNLLPTSSPETRSFVSQLLCFDPRKRATAAELLQHPYLAALHDPTDEPVAAQPFVWKLEAVELDRAELEKQFLLEASVVW
jgi:serine/threonine protein kinase